MSRKNGQAATVPEGYKMTEVGVIPEEWGIASFDQLFSFSNGVNADKSAYGKGIRFVNVLEPITYSHLYGPEIPGKISLSQNTTKNYLLEYGDVLFNRTSETDSELGLAATFLGSDDVVFGGFVIRGRPITDTLDPVYSGYAIRASVIRAQIVPLGQGAVRANIGQQSLRQVKAPIPPLPEQRAIATALSDTDDLIESLERLIAKKRRIKEGAMGELLSGKRRLEGFEGEWEERSLADIGTWQGGGTPSMSNALFWTNGSIPWASSADIRSGILTSTLKSITKLAVESSSTNLIDSGSILIVMRSGILRRFLPIARNEVPVAVNQDIKALTPDADIDSCFLQYSLVFLGSAILSTCMKAGTTVESIEFGWLKKFVISIPSLPEQHAIATLLTDMDREIDALEEKLAKVRRVKEGMMGELLGGRVRLV